MRANEKYLEIIHAEMDGEASEKESAALREYLATSPKGRETQGELARLADILSRVEIVEPPGDFKQSIMLALPLPRPSIGSAMQRKSRRVGFSIFKYGYAVAAGLLLGLVLARVTSWDMSVPRTADLSGTLSSRENAALAAPSDQMRVDRAGLAGSVKLSRARSIINMQFDVDANQNAEVIVSFDGTRCAFRSFDQQLAPARSFVAGQDRVEFIIQGVHHSTLLLNEGNSAEVLIDLKFLISGRLVQSGTLRLPRPE